MNASTVVATAFLSIPVVWAILLTISAFVIVVFYLKMLIISVLDCKDTVFQSDTEIFSDNFRFF
jgi:hypothetical protein